MLPGLDVTDVLDDPDFLDTSLLVYRTNTSADGQGLGRSLPLWLPFSAVVIPDADDDLKQTLDGDMLDGTLTLYTRFPLTTGDGDGNQADRIRWGNGGPGVYRVIAARRWAYGQGYTQAIVTLADLNPTDLGAPNDTGHLG